LLRSGDTRNRFNQTVSPFILFSPSAIPSGFVGLFDKLYIYIVKKQKTTQPMTNTGQNIHEDTRTHNEK